MVQSMNLLAALLQLIHSLPAIASYIGQFRTEALVNYIPYNGA